MGKQWNRVLWGLEKGSPCSLAWHWASEWSQAPSTTHLTFKYVALRKFWDFFDECVSPKPWHSMKSVYNNQWDTFCKEPVADRASLQIVWNFFSFLSHGYLIISQGKRWVWSANKRYLNKLAPGHIIQTLGIVLCWQASTGREPPEKLLLGWVGLLCSTRISVDFFF